jgi:hypothetical protein
VWQADPAAGAAPTTVRWAFTFAPHVWNPDIQYGMHKNNFTLELPCTSYTCRSYTYGEREITQLPSSCFKVERFWIKKYVNWNVSYKVSQLLHFKG